MTRRHFLKLTAATTAAISTPTRAQHTSANTLHDLT